MKSTEIRKKFFDFFIQHDHEKVPSSSLIPAQDPTLLFTNAGMNQFKDVFLGKETRSYKRAVSIQKCMRAGGKHNDLDNVGFTARHLTFFEMMGNFSFGDYFKHDAIRYAWDFLTGPIGFKPASMYATVYFKDDEAFDIWHKEIGLPTNHIYRLGEIDNFWQMGDTGPCGPCSEIYIDRGERYGCGKPTCAPGCSCDRFLEVWNLVFMQYDRQSDGTDKPLKQVGVDTGMGLERLALLIEGKDSVFETDLFEHVMRRIEQLTQLKYEQQNAAIKGAFNVLADHARASCFLIADGVNPSNEGRGYVLRKVIRRAALFAQKLTEKSLFPELATAVIRDMGGIYPELQEHESIIIRILTAEVEKFSTNLIQGQHILDRYCKESSDNIIKGEQVFKLYDTYGFPLEITRIIAHERGLTVDIDGFEKYMEEQRQRSGKKETTQEVVLSEDLKTEFTGYDHFMTEAHITGLLHDEHEVQEVAAGVTCWVITDKSPFYVEKGGQVSDQGWLLIDKQKIPVQELKRFDGSIGARITTVSKITIGQPIGAIVDRESRLSTMKNHTATHLLQAALIALFGKQVRQAGSLVAPDYLRFDFTYHEHLTPDQIKQIETIVNAKIWENIPVSIFTTTYKKAIDKGVMAIFGEKYNPENVRVIDIPGFSAELCGGTHVRSTGDIGCFKITEVAALSAGQRRIVAVTGPKALALFQDNFTVIKQLGQDFRVPYQDVLQAVYRQREQLKIAHDDLKSLHKKLIALRIPQWLQAVREINTVPYGFIHLENSSSDQMRDVAQDLITKKPGFYVIFTEQEQQCLLVALVSPLYQKRINLKEFATWLKQQCNIHGGGKQNIFQGGGPYVNADQLNKAIEQWLMGIKN